MRDEYNVIIQGPRKGKALDEGEAFVGCIETSGVPKPPQTTPNPCQTHPKPPQTTPCRVWGMFFGGFGGFLKPVGFNS